MKWQLMKRQVGGGKEGEGGGGTEGGRIVWDRLRNNSFLFKRPLGSVSNCITRLP